MSISIDDPGLSKWEVLDAQVHLSRKLSEFQSHNVFNGELDSSTASSSAIPQDPAIVAADGSEQIAYLRKLKFQYLEQHAKAKYVKCIVSDIDDAPIFTHEDNEILREANLEKKEKLRAAKRRMEEMHQRLRESAARVDTDFQRARAAKERNQTLKREIMNTKITLARLRQAHPQPRLTIATADETLAKQVERMQLLDDDLKQNQDKFSERSTTLKTESKALDRLRAERAEAEREAERKKPKDATKGRNDELMGELFAWFTASVNIHHALTDLQKCIAPSDNELRLSYVVSRKLQSLSVDVSLVFAPESRRLGSVSFTAHQSDSKAAVELGISDSDLGAFVDANDVHGAISTILTLARRNVDL